VQTFSKRIIAHNSA